jgi:proteasome lid subunit RPN8/RPN11
MKEDYLMEGSPELNLLNLSCNGSLGKIAKNLKKTYPFESGGLVYGDFSVKQFESRTNNRHEYLPVNSFFLSLVRDKPIFCYHSHLNSPEPSEKDLFFVKSYGIALIIYSLHYKVFLSVNSKYETRSFSWPPEVLCRT